MDSYCYYHVVCERRASWMKYYMRACTVCVHKFVFLSSVAFYTYDLNANRDDSDVFIFFFSLFRFIFYDTFAGARLSRLLYYYYFYTNLIKASVISFSCAAFIPSYVREQIASTCEKWWKGASATDSADAFKQKFNFGAHFAVSQHLLICEEQFRRICGGDAKKNK